MKDAVSYWSCFACLRVFKIEEEPEYANLAEVGQISPTQVMFCPFCGDGNLQAVED